VLRVGDYLHSYAARLAASVRPVLRLRSDRRWEVDAWRGIAICIMVVYHLVWDLRSFGGYEIAVRSGFWGVWQVVTAGLFTILVGVSLTLSYRRERESQPQGSLWGTYVIRGATVFTWGLVVSGVTFLALGPDRFVHFGILHLIGVSIVIAYPLLRFRWLNLALAVGIIGLGYAVRALSPEVPWLEWLAPTPGRGVDYAPLIPMFSRVLIGIFLGNLLYPRVGARWVWARLADHAVVRALRLMGQNSLLIYLGHQPVLIAALFLLGVAEW